MFDKNLYFCAKSKVLATQGKYFLMLSSIGMGAMFSPPKIRNVLVCIIWDYNQWLQHLIAEAEAISGRMTPCFTRLKN